MFDREKKERGYDEGMDSAPAASAPRSTPASAPRPASGGGPAVIGRSIQINGDVRGDEDLRIEGDISGTVQLKNANLTIGKEGRVKADVYAKSITVDGTTEGDLYATERVSVHVNANVRGNITAPKVGIEEGCKFKGSIEMDQEEVDKALSKVNMQGSTAKPQSGKGPEPRIASTNPVKGAVAN
jgi:cytoskeletal protein CcmA (bactofilin family)